MAIQPSGAVVKGMLRLYGEGTVAGLSEGQLLERFAQRRDEAAFEALVARHGPMVLSVCRGALRDPNDADDAFQATFLILARKASTIRGTERLGAWLHRVARRVAVRASVETVRRRSKERPDPVEPIAPADDPERFELRNLVHEEVDRLSDSFRAAVVLCDLEGQTHEEAAHRLNWPVGTVKGRLFRARAQLRDRLLRRGLVAPTALAAVSTGLTSEALSSVVPDVLRDSTVQAATAFAAGRSAVASGLAPAAVALAEGVLAMLWKTKIKAVAGGLASAMLLAVGLGGLALGGPRGDDPPKPGDSAKATLSEASTKVADAKPAEAKPSANEAPSILGEWNFVGVSGMMPPYQPESMSVTPEAMIWRLGGNGTQEKTLRFTYTRKDDTNPKQIDMTAEKGKEKGQRRLGIYQVSEEGLTIALSATGQPRPRFFSDDPNDPERDEQQPDPPNVSRLSWRRLDPVAGRMGGPPGMATRKDDRQAIQGQWWIASVEVDGRPQVLPDDRKSQEVNINNFGFSQQNKDGQIGLIRYQLDPAQSPATIDFLSPSVGGGDGAEDKSTNLSGIYLLKGNRLTICLGRAGSLRPTEFVTVGPNGARSGAGSRLLVLRRGPKPLDPPAAIVGYQTGSGGTGGHNVPPIARPAETPKPTVATGVQNTEAEVNLEFAELEAEAIQDRLRTAVKRLSTLEDERDSRSSRGPFASTGPSAEQSQQAIVAATVAVKRAKDDYLSAKLKVSEMKAQVESLGGASKPMAVDSSKGTTTPGDRKPWTAKVGDTLVVEVLVALPGRPIVGERRVREDGTISLGFYGDVPVEGLTRREIKEKVIQHLRKNLTDEHLGIGKIENADGTKVDVTPADSGQVFVDNVPEVASPADTRLRSLEEKVDRLMRKLEAGGRMPNR